MILKYEETADRELLTVCPFREGVSGGGVMVASWACELCAQHEGLNLELKEVECLA